MTTPHAATDREYEDWAGYFAFALARHQPTEGSSAPVARGQRWAFPPADDTTVAVFIDDFDFHQNIIGDQDGEMFLQLVEQWRAERLGATSSMAEIVACPSHLRIIGMGWRAVPLIIEQLEIEGDEPDHWCAALEAITGEDPVPKDAHGDTVRIAQAWIEWNKVRSAWFFPTSTTRTIESPARGLAATTASLGLPNLM